MRENNLRRLRAFPYGDLFANLRCFRLVADEFGLASFQLPNAGQFINPSS